MAVALFLGGSRWYRKTPPKDNVIGNVFRVVQKALSNRRRAPVHDKAHWLDHYMSSHSCPVDPQCSQHYCQKAAFVEDVKAFLRVCVMYVPVPIFWALFDQQGSRWVLQAVYMNGRVGPFTILPDQIGILNSFLILVFIPVFQLVVYPLVRAIGINPTPLRRMVSGGFLASASFVLAMFVQLAVARTLPVQPDAAHLRLRFANVQPCTLSLRGPGFSQRLPSGQTWSTDMLPAPSSRRLSWSVSGTCLVNETVVSEVSGGQSYVTTLAPGLAPLTAAEDLHKPTEGAAEFKIAVTNALSSGSSGGLAWCRCPNADCDPRVPSCDPTAGDDGFRPFHAAPGNTSAFVKLRMGDGWGLFRSASGNDTGSYVATPFSLVTEEQGGIYDLVIYGTHWDNATELLWPLTPPNSVPILWQAPQYVVITAGEILFSITGLEFSYSQAPRSMKACVQAAWLLTTAGGNLIDFVITGSHLIADPAWELLMFAGLMAAVMCVFMALSVFYYQYAHFDSPHAERKDDDDIPLDLVPPRSD